MLVEYVGKNFVDFIFDIFLLKNIYVCSIVILLKIYFNFIMYV